MKRSLRFLVVGLALLLLGPAVYAGEYSSDFDLYLADHQSDDMVGAIVSMADRVDLDALKQELYARRADRREWHETVVLALQEKAANTQVDILAQLEQLADDGLVAKFRGLWIGNIVFVTATREALDILVARGDVEAIYPDYDIENIDPVSKGDDTPIIAGVENGLRAIRADEVWAMGYTGAGRLVSHLDTGVDGNHPALNARWRGYDPRYEGHPEWAWFDPLTNTQFPQDWGSHGTHTMGTICGLGESSGDTIGVALGAQWISCGVIDRQSIPRTVQDALASFEWLVDPDGDPGTVWDVADVCSNSWRVTTGHGYPPCDETFWEVLDGCEAAGIFVVFAAGNEGPGPYSIGRPPDRATTDVKSFAVGALDGNNNNYPIAGFSSRGPSDCTPTGDPTFKPEVSAPGVNVRSSVPGGGYQGGWSGTSMACPHVAGVVALMREANPNLTTDQIGEILLETAVEVPADQEEGEDNTYGMGMVDAYEAVILALAYLEGWGTLAGYITDEASGDPIQGATVSVIDRPWSAQSNGAGWYRLFMPADTLWDIRVENPPTHLPEFDQIMVVENETTFVDYALEGKVTVELSASFANPEDVSYRSFFLKGSWDNDGFYDESWSGDPIEVTDGDEDGIYTGQVMLARDTENTYSWAIYSENYGGEDARLDDGADFDIPTLDPPVVPTLVVNPSGSDNNWIISVEGDNDLSLDLMQGIDNNEFKWGAATALVGGVTYTFRFHVMHSDVASYGSGGIGGADLTYTPEVDGSFDFIFNDYDDSYLVQLTGTEGPPTYLSTQSGLDGHIPVSWLPPGTVESQEMYYDDGVLANAYYYYAYDNLMATMFVPESHPVTIDSAIIHVLTEGDPYWPWPDGSPDPIGISIFLDNGSGMPETDPVFYEEVTGELGEWIRVDVDEILVSSGNFWIAMNNLAGGGEEGVGLDAYTDYPGNQWVREGGIWGLQPYYEGDHMIRAKVFGGGRLDWMGYDSKPAGELPGDIPIFLDASGTAGSSRPMELKSATETRLIFDRMAYHPWVTRTHPPMGTDTQVLAGYNLYRDVEPSPFDRELMINSELITETNYDDWGDDPYGPIVNGVTYYYQGSAVYDIGEGQFVEVGPSNEATGMAVNHPPTPPDSLVGSSLADTVYLSWNLAEDYDIAQYRIFRRDYGESEFNLVGTVDHPENIYSEIIEVDGIYRYKVASVDAEGMQSDGYSNSVDVPIGAIPPRELTASTDLEFRIDLDWRHPGRRPLVPNLNVLVIAADEASQFLNELQQFDDIELVDYFDARNGNPTLEQLSEYDVAVVWSNYQFADPYGMGDVLADYVDNGGGVVLQQFSFGTGWNLDGRIMNEYSPFSPGPTQYMNLSLGDYDSGHPIMDGIGDITEYYMADVSIVNDGEWVASWDDGTPFVAYSPEANVVAVNGYVGDYRQFTGDMIMLVHNAMNYALGGAEVIPDNYKVYKSDNESGPFNEIVELPGEVREYTDEPVPNGVDYWYFVTAIYPGPEESDPTNIAVGHGQNHPPEPPENLEGVVDNRDVTLTWTFEDIMGDLDHFNIYKKIVPGGDFEYDGSSTEMTYVMTIPEGEDGTYAIVVTAVDDGDPQMESAYSNQIYASVGNLPPVNLRGTSNQEDHVPLMWNEPGLRPCTTLFYDDGILVNGYYYFAYDNIMANRFVASSPVEVETLWVHVLTEGDPFWPWPDGSHDPVGISLWDDDGSGYPGDMAYYTEVVCELGEWIMVPIEGGVTLDGPNFWVGMNNLEGGGEDGMGLDANTDFPEHKWARESGSWYQQDIFYGDHMIRVTIIDSGGRLLRLDESAPTIDLAAEDQSRQPSSPMLSVPKLETNTLTGSIGDIPTPLDIMILLGYNVYRSEEPDVPVDPEHRINEEYIVDTEYDDTDIVNGTTYYYVATAVYDNEGEIEESPPSNEVELTPRMGARLAVDPTSFDESALPGDIIERTLNISNAGGLDLDFGISISENRLRFDGENPDEGSGFEGGYQNDLKLPASSAGEEDLSAPEAIDFAERLAVSALDESETLSGRPQDDGILLPQISVLVIAADYADLYISELDSFDDIDYVDYYDARYGTPSLDELNNYTSVVVWSNYQFSDPWGMGDVLADYADGGGGVVLHQFAFGSGWNLEGRMMDEYSPLSPGSISYTSHYLGDYDESSPIMDGVSYVSDVFMSYVSLINNGEWVASYDDGTPFVAFNPGNHVVAINGYVGDSRQFDGDMIILSHNAVVFATSGVWLSVDPRNGTVGPGDNMDVAVTFDATEIEEGSYSATLTVAGYDMNGFVDQIDIPVTFIVGSTGIDDEIDLPAEFSLSQNYPNPFNPATDVSFALPRDSHVTLEIFNILGQKVRTLVDDDMEAGYQSVTWNGDDDQGRQVASGIYLYKLNAGDKTFTRKMMMLK
jgi:subtilisin family serine protease